jgi:AraC-like DNA-binding protein
MYGRSFPDINWLKKQIELDFPALADLDQNGTEISQLPQSIASPIKRRGQGWPNAILDIQSCADERMGIQGPFSIFYTTSGEQQVAIDGREKRLFEGQMLLTNQGQVYDLKVDEEDAIFNIHFGRKLCEEVEVGLGLSDQTLLDNPQSRMSWQLFSNKIYSSSIIESRLVAFQQACRMGLNQAKEEEYLMDLLSALHQDLSGSNMKRKSIHALSVSHREELLRRMNLAEDYMRSNLDRELQLDEVCRQAMLSKFHFIRLFRKLHAKTSARFFRTLRLEQANRYLGQGMSPNEVCEKLGYSYVESFYRAFRKEFGRAPLQMGQMLD